MRLTADWLVVGDRAGTVIADAAMDVDADGRISWVGPAAAAPPSDSPETVLSGALCPGFVNTHAHGPMTLFRGLGEGLPVDRWLREVMWPREARLTGDDIAAGMSLACAEMLRNGITTSAEMYIQAERIIAAARAVDIRVLVAAPLLAPPGDRQQSLLDRQLGEAFVLADRHRDDPYVEVCLGPHSAYAVPLPFLAEATAQARERNLLTHLHVAESRDEGAAVTADRGTTVPRALADIGALDGRVLAAHSVWLDDADLALWRDYDVGVAHCPGSNAKLASGSARLTDMLTAGIRVGLGTDGPASNNTLDMLEEVRLAARFARLATGDATAFPAVEAFWLATGGGAAALGRDDIGILEPGRWADLVQVDVDDSAFIPLESPTDLLTHLVWSASGRHLRGTWVAGRQVVADGRCLTVEEPAIREEVRRRAHRLNAS